VADSDAAPETVRVAPEPLRALVERLFVARGVPAPDAAEVAEVLVEADLRGVESHGTTRVAG
jgi:LDH2 family malate/lactate/ureidoglycolate dehydrogenase